MPHATFQHVEAPASNAAAIYETLGYLEAYDGVLDLDYAFVAYREKACATGEWRVRIRSSRTAGAILEPATMARCAREAAAQGRDWFPWGHRVEPTAADPRAIEFRVHVCDGRPAEVEVRVRLRRVDHRPGEWHALRFAWPEGASADSCAA